MKTIVLCILASAVLGATLGYFTGIKERAYWVRSAVNCWSDRT